MNKDGSENLLAMNTAAGAEGVIIKHGYPFMQPGDSGATVAPIAAFGNADSVGVDTSRKKIANHDNQVIVAAGSGHDAVLAELFSKRCLVTQLGAKE